jgi:hypothetical protein
MKDEKDKEQVSINVRLPVQEYEQVARVAIEQSRSACGQVRHLVREALQHREARA